MSKFVAVLLLLTSIFVGCPMDGKDFSRKRGSQLLVEPDVSARSEMIISETMSGIYAEIIKCQKQYPQLAGISDARITHYIDGHGTAQGYILYERCITGSNKTEGPICGKDGCQINIEIKFPAQPRDPADTSLVPQCRFKNGKVFELWANVSGERNLDGRNFVNAMYDIINPQITCLMKQLKQLP
jgi:hypothetical protein